MAMADDAMVSMVLVLEERMMVVPGLVSKDVA